MSEEFWEQKYQSELDQAVAARKSGNEGMARVCARRALGWVLGEYFEREGIDFPNPSAYERVRLFLSLPNIPETIKKTAEHFIVRITPEHKLPIEADLIGEVSWLKQNLLERDPD